MMVVAKMFVSRDSPRLTVCVVSINCVRKGRLSDVRVTIRTAIIKRTVAALRVSETQKVLKMAYSPPVKIRNAVQMSNATLFSRLMAHALHTTTPSVMTNYEATDEVEAYHNCRLNSH